MDEKADSDATSTSPVFLEMIQNQVFSFAPRLLLVTSRKNNRGLHGISQAGRQGFAWGEPGQIFLSYLLGGLDSTWALRSNTT
jgi:hypothetical protein